MKKIEVKICGMRTIETVQAAIENGARYIGFIVEYPKSKRSISREEVRKIIEASSRSENADFVGVFVDRPIDEIAEIVRSSGITIVQLHGNEDVEYIRSLRKKVKIPVWKFVELKTENDLRHIYEYKNAAEKVLVDAGKGSGEVIGENLLRDALRLKIDGIAGGLSPENVNEYIEKYSPEIIDVSSGVESEKGIKSVELIKKFMNNVKKTYV